jgi:hypothetical protein
MPYPPTPQHVKSNPPTTSRIMGVFDLPFGGLFRGRSSSSSSRRRGRFRGRSSSSSRLRGGLALAGLAVGREDGASSRFRGFEGFEPLVSGFGNGGGAFGGAAVSAGVDGSDDPGGTIGAAACAGGITYAHFGHFTAGKHP